MPRRVGSRACAVAAVLSVMLGCRDDEATRTQTQPVRPATGLQKASTEPPAKTSTCQSLPGPAFKTPGEAFAKYSQTVEARNWCSAVQHFVPAARHEVAQSMVRALLILAGTPNPKQDDYLTALNGMWRGLSAPPLDEVRRATLVAESLNGNAPPIPELGAADAETVYQASRVAPGFPS